MQRQFDTSVETTRRTSQSCFLLRAQGKLASRHLTGGSELTQSVPACGAVAIPHFAEAKEDPLGSLRFPGMAEEAAHHEFDVLLQHLAGSIPTHRPWLQPTHVQNAGASTYPKLGVGLVAQARQQLLSPSQLNLQALHLEFGGAANLDGNLAPPLAMQNCIKKKTSEFELAAPCTSQHPAQAFRLCSWHVVSRPVQKGPG